MNYSLLIIGGSDGDRDGGGVDGDDLRGQFPVPAGCRNRVLSPRNLVSSVAAATGLFVEDGEGFLGFSIRGEYMGEEAEPGEARGPHTPPRRGQRGGAPGPRVGSLWAPCCSPSGSRKLLVF